MGRDERDEEERREGGGLLLSRIARGEMPVTCATAPVLLRSVLPLWPSGEESTWRGGSSQGRSSLSPGHVIENRFSTGCPPGV